MSACPYCGADPAAPVRARWRISLPLEPPSQNEISSANRGSVTQRRAYRRFRDGYALLLNAWKHRDQIPAPQGKRRVIFERVYSGRGKPRDKGNLIGGMKPLLDALVIAGLLVDDDEAHVEDHYRQRRCASGAGVIVRLEDLIAEPAREQK